VRKPSSSIFAKVIVKKYVCDTLYQSTSYVDKPLRVMLVCVYVRECSSVYPLFKPGASSLGGACLSAHVTIQPCLVYADVSEDCVRIEILSESCLRKCHM